jgi:hypothetical protein
LASNAFGSRIVFTSAEMTPPSFRLPGLPDKQKSRAKPGSRNKILTNIRLYDGVMRPNRPDPSRAAPR